MKKNLKRWACLIMIALCMLQMPVSCHVQGSDDAMVWETLTAEEYCLDDFSDWKQGKYSENNGKYESWSG